VTVTKIAQRRPNTPGAHGGPDDDPDTMTTDEHLNHDVDSAMADDAPGDTVVDTNGSAGGVRRIAGWVLTVLACLLVLFALVAPDDLSLLTPAALLRIPVEGLVVVALALVLPVRAKRIVVAVFGVILGLLTVVKIIDMGFFVALSRSFDPVLDWAFFEPAVNFLTGSFGHLGAIAAIVGAAVLAVAQKAFVQEEAVDAFRDTPPNQLLTGLRGKNVLLVFVESYGRVAIQDSSFSPRADNHGVRPRNGTTPYTMLVAVYGVTAEAGVIGQVSGGAVVGSAVDRRAPGTTASATAAHAAPRARPPSTSVG
jgi:hypothetical protein